MNHADAEATHPDPHAPEWPEPVVDLALGLRHVGGLADHDAVTVTGATPSRLEDVAMYTLQGTVRPGGRVTFHTDVGPTERRRMERIVGHWFDGPAPVRGERFRLPRFEPAAHGGHVMVAYRAGGGTTLGHFDALAEDYAGEIPAHVVAHYRERKLRHVRDALGSSGKRVLDLGCGVGLYAREVADRYGAHVVAVDASPASVKAASGAVHDPGEPGVRFAASDALRLPFRDASFDVVYAINVLHHLKRGEQTRMFDEVARVLRPGGRMLVFEINVRNPLFRFYMRKVFPRTRDIDRGDEEFLDPRRLPVPDSLHTEAIKTYTFLPDFLPRLAVRALQPVERALEATPIGAWGIHYTATLRRREDDA